MLNNLIISIKTTNPENIGTNASTKGKKLTLVDMFIKYLTVSSKEINLPIFQEEKPKDKKSTLNYKLNKLLKKTFLKNQKKHDLDFHDFLSLVDRKQINYSDYESLFDIISKKQSLLLTENNIKAIFTQTRNCNGALPSNLEVFLYRFLIINIINFSQLEHDNDNKFLELIRFFFKIPLFYVEEGIILLSVVFNEIITLIDNHFVNQKCENYPKSSQFIKSVVNECVIYLFNEPLTSGRFFASYEMHSLLLAHFTDQIIFYPENVADLTQLVTALTKVKLEISLADAQFFYGSLIKIASYFFKTVINDKFSIDSAPVRFGFFLMDKIFFIAQELAGSDKASDQSQIIQNQKDMFKTLPVELSHFIEYVIDRSQLITSITEESFDKFSEKESNLYNNDKQFKKSYSVFIESNNKKFYSNLKDLQAKLISRDIATVSDYPCLTFNKDATFINKFMLQIKNYENKIILIILLKELSLRFISQIKESKTMRSSAKLLVVMNFLLQLVPKDFAIFLNEINQSKSPEQYNFLDDLSSIFVFDDKYFYFTNPVLKTSLLFRYMNHDNNDSLFNIVEKLPSDLDLYENLRHSILFLFLVNYTTYPIEFMTIISKKLDDSVSPQVSNFFICMLRSFFRHFPDLTAKTMKDTKIFDIFGGKYLPRLRDYYIHYCKDPSILNYVQEYRYNAMLLIIQFSAKVSPFQILFSSYEMTYYIFKYGLFEEDSCGIALELIKEVLNSLDEKLISTPTVNNLVSLFIITSEYCAESIFDNKPITNTKGESFDYSSYCLQLLHNIFTMFGESIHSKQIIFADCFAEKNFPSIICEIPNKLTPINSPNKLDIVNDILYIICGLTKDSDVFKKRFVGPMKKQKLAQLLNSIELNDNIIQNLILLIFGKNINSKSTDNNDIIIFNKALPFLHVSLLNKPQYYNVFFLIYEASQNSLSNRIQIYKSKLLSLFITEIQKYPDLNKMTEKQHFDIDLMFNIFKNVTTSFSKTTTLLEVLKTLQKKDYKERPWYVAKFIRLFNDILSKCSENKQISTVSTSFFHFNGNNNGISVPQFSITEKEGFSIVLRFELDSGFMISNVSKPTLLSFSTSNTKIKLFFEKDELSIKCKKAATKSKSKITSNVEKVKFSFSPNLWYTLILRGLSGDKLELFINSGDKPIHSSAIDKHCSFDEFSSFTVANKSLSKNKGLICNVSVIYFFNKLISSEKIKDLMLLPYKFSYLFIPSNQYLYPDLPSSLFSEKFEKSLLFCYNSNMFDGQMAVNLVRGNSSSCAEVKGINVPYNSSLIGAISNLGGIKAFIPLFEIIDTVSENNTELLNMILEILLFLNQSSEDFENEFCKSNGIQAFAHAFSNIPKSAIDAFVFKSLYKFYCTFKIEKNQVDFIKIFWFNYNVWDKMTIEQHQLLLSICLKPILSDQEQIFSRNISYPFIISVLKDIPDDSIRELYFTYVEFFSRYYFAKVEQKFVIQLAFSSQGVFQGQVLKTFYFMMKNKNDCYLKLIKNDVYRNLIALSTSSNEETRIYAIKILIWMKNNNKKEPIPLNIAIYSFIKTLNFENITDRTWNELENSVFEDDDLSDRIIELLPLFAAYSYKSDCILADSFIQKLYNASIKNHECYKKIRSSPNWLLNLFYIYLNSRKPVLNFSENHILINYLQNMFLHLLDNQLLDEYRNSMNLLLLIQFIHHLDVSLFTRQIIDGILLKPESEKPSIYKALIPDAFVILFYIPSHNKTIKYEPFSKTYEHSKEINWNDFILQFNFNPRGGLKRRSSTSFPRTEDDLNTSKSITQPPIDEDNKNTQASSPSSIKIKIDYSDFKGYFGMRNTTEGRWYDIQFGQSLEKRLLSVIKALQGKPVDKTMSTCGHNSNKISLSYYDLLAILEIIIANLGINSLDCPLNILLSNIKSSSGKKLTLQILSYLTSVSKDQSKRVELIFNYIKEEYSKEIDAFINEKKASGNDIKNKMDDQNTQIQFLEYFHKDLDIFDTIANDCNNFFKNSKDWVEIAKCCLEMTQHESYPLEPKIAFVRTFTDQYPMILLNMKNTCLSAYKKLSQEIISYESGSNEQKNLHWKLSNRLDIDFRHVMYKINEDFDIEFYKKFLKDTNVSQPNKEEADSSNVKTENTKCMDDNSEQISDDNDDDVSGEVIDTLGDIDEDEENDSSKSKSNLVPDNENETDNKNQKVISSFTTNAVLISIMKHFYGSLSISEDKITYVGKQMNKLMSSTEVPVKYRSKQNSEMENNEMMFETSNNSKTIQFNLSDIRMILLRNYLHIKEGIEIFLINRKSYFFFLTEFNRISVINYLSKHQKLLTNCLIFQKTPQKVIQFLQEKKITESWVNGKISNYHYLIILNLFSGRSFNDSTQYPVFPWILKEYNKTELDLNDPNNYRDLSLPILSVGGNIEEKKMNFEEIDIEFNKAHNHKFYSNESHVSFLLIRNEPFITSYLNLQKYYDLDRFPYDLGKLYDSSSKSTGSELIPELFTTPEIFVNNDKDIYYGTEKCNKMILPNWVSNQSPQDFIRKHRLALESDYVSQHLNEWIDLIFGFAQTGPEAIDRCNTYLPFLYPKFLAQHKSHIKQDPCLFTQVQSYAMNFGIVPNQLFSQKHPQRTVNSRSYCLFNNVFSNAPCDSLNRDLQINSTNISIGDPHKNTKPIPLYMASNETIFLTLSSDSRLTVFQSKSLFNQENHDGKNSPSKAKSSSGKIKSVFTDLSTFILIKSGIDTHTENVTNPSLTKNFCFLSGKVVVTSPHDSEIRIFKIKSDDLNDVINLSSNNDCIYQNCIDLNSSKPGMSVFSLYSNIQLPSTVLMTCRAGQRDFVTVSNDFSVMKWCIKKGSSDNGSDGITDNNYEFGPKASIDNSSDSLKGKRKGSLMPVLNNKSRFTNRVKMSYRIMPHSTKIVAINASWKSDLLVSCDKEKNLILSRLSDGVFIRSFKTSHKVKSLIIADTPCIVISMIYKIDKSLMSSNSIDDDIVKYTSSILTFPINNNKNDNIHEEPISQRVFDTKVLKAWCLIQMNFDTDCFVACSFDDNSLMIFGLPMLNKVYETSLHDSVVSFCYNRKYNTLLIGCNDGVVYNLRF